MNYTINSGMNKAGNIGFQIAMGLPVGVGLLSNPVTTGLALLGTTVGSKVGEKIGSSLNTE